MNKREWKKIPMRTRKGLGHLAAIVETDLKKRPNKYGPTAQKELEAAITWIWHRWAE